MKILSKEFSSYLRGWYVCWAIGHKRSPWLPALNGRLVIFKTKKEARHCMRCGKRTDEREIPASLTQPQKLKALESAAKHMRDRLGIKVEKADS